MKVKLFELLPNYPILNTEKLERVFLNDEFSSSFFYNF